MSVSNEAIGASLGSIWARTRSVVAATSGPRRSMPPAVTNRVFSPARIALCTRLAAAVTPCSKFAAVGVGSWARVEHDGALVEPLDGVLLHHQLVAAGRCTPVDAPRLVAGGVLAQPVEVAGAESPGRVEQRPPEGAVAEPRHVDRQRSRRHDDVVDADDRRWSSERCRARRRRSDRKRSETDHTTRRASAPDIPMSTSCARRSDGTGSRATWSSVMVRTTGSSSTNGAEAATAGVPQSQVDLAGLAGNEHRRVDPPVGLDARSACPRRRRRRRPRRRRTQRRSRTAR